VTSKTRGGQGGGKDVAGGEHGNGVIEGKLGEILVASTYITPHQKKKTKKTQPKKKKKPKKEGA